MAYRYGNREQISFLPTSIEEYVAEDDPVRVYDSFVEALDLKDLDLVIDENQKGNSEYDPVSMLKLLVYGYSYGFRSSRKLERAVYHNLTFIWLMGGLKPDHKTISRFRRDHKSVLAKVLKQCARICLKLGLVSGSTLFVDGTKMQGNCSLKHTWNKDQCKDALKRVDQRIEQILSECEKVDQQEEADESHVKIPKELVDKKQLRKEIVSAMQSLENSDHRSVNTVDPESVTLKQHHGRWVNGYNAQIVVDKANGLIVNTDVVTEVNDLGQFAVQIKQASEVLNTKCEIAVADAGYHAIEQLKEVEKLGTKVIVPSKPQASKKNTDQYKHAGFIYDKAKDCYICPQGHTASFSYSRAGFRIYKMRKSICKECVCRQECTKSEEGRAIHRHIKADDLERFAIAYEKGKDIFRLRKEKVEHPFGHIRRNLGVSSFLIKGIGGAKAELGLIASTFNIRRAITLLGAKDLIKSLSSV